MPRIRSKKLWQYLFDAGVLNGSEADILKAKAEYRKKYKREWKQNRLIPKKELRPTFTLKEYQMVRFKAQTLKLTATAFLKEVTLASIEGKQIIYNKEELLKILQLISMSIIAFGNNEHRFIITEQLYEAEKLLLEYVKQNDC